MIDVKVMERRFDAMKNVERVVAKVTVRTPKGEFFETAWVRNFGVYGVSPMVSLKILHT